MNMEESNNGSKKLQIRNSTAEFLIFQIENKEEGIEVLYQDETLWLTQKTMSILFDVDIRTINEHLKNIYSQGEVDKNTRGCVKTLTQPFFYAQSPDFLKPGLCYYPKFSYL